MKQNFECTGCKTHLAGHELYQAGPFQPGYCSKCWAEVMGKEIACPNCYGGHFRPCQWCGDTGRVTNVPHPYNNVLGDDGAKPKDANAMDQTT